MFKGRPVLVLIKLRGDTNQLMRTLEPLHDAQAKANVSEGLILHTVGPDAGGVLMADLWKSAEHYQSFVRSSAAHRGNVRPSWPKPEIEIHDVHAVIGSPEEMTVLLSHRLPGSATLGTVAEETNE